MIKVQLTLFLLLVMNIQGAQSTKYEQCGLQGDKCSFADICKDIKEVITGFVCDDPDFAKASHDANGFSWTNKENRALVYSCLQAHMKKIKVNRELDDLFYSPYLNPLGYFLLTKEICILKKGNMQKLKRMVNQFQGLFYPRMFEILTNADAIDKKDILARSVKKQTCIIRKTLYQYVVEVWHAHDCHPDPDTYLIIDAIKSNNTKVLKFVLGFRCKDDLTKPLIKAVYSSNLEIVKLLLDYGAKPAAKALIGAIEQSKFDIVEFLLDQGADPNMKVGQYGYPPLFVAIRLGKLEMVKLLLKYKADPKVSDETTAIDLAKKLANEPNDNSLRCYYCKNFLQCYHSGELPAIINHLENLETFSHSKNS